MSDTLRILAIFLLVLGNAVFVAAEYALVTARRTRLEPEADAGSRRARSALDLMDHPVKFIGTVQIGITVFGIALGAIGQPLLTDYFDSPFSYGVAYALAFLILTYLSVALGELVPKALALQYPTAGREDQQINSRAIPQLRSQVLAAQSAKIDGVSGATFTTDGYISSLQSALDAAGVQQ